MVFVSFSLNPIQFCEMFVYRFNEWNDDVCTTQRSMLLLFSTYHVLSGVNTDSLFVHQVICGELFMLCTCIVRMFALNRAFVRRTNKQSTAKNIPSMSQWIGQNHSIDMGICLQFGIEDIFYLGRNTFWMLYAIKFSV